MNSKTSKRANHCQQQSEPQRPWQDHGPFLPSGDEASELDEPFQSERLDALLEEDPDIDLEDFLDDFN